MAPDLLPADTAMGAVTLLVADPDAMTRYYRDAIGLDVLAADAGTVTLGRGGRALIHLEFAPDLSPAALGSAGLFHTAILFESRAALAAAVYSTATLAPASFTGSADHLVSQAFYFTDPEGNGVELYWDRDRTQWSWVHGHIEMATLALDPNAFIREHIELDTAAASTTPLSPGGAEVGHVHLSVGDIAQAREFYVDRLGFETTAALGDQALFVSAGGYHHHMAMNTWASRGASPRTRALGLGEVDIVVPSSDEVGALVERMTHFGSAPADDGRTVTISDPWNNTIRVTSSA
ncbi:VOC family protein [Marisediminicola sp. LYQ134]|uniref:VOC family protein n=1 Tax=unclassified Marisediminicola TaxID=2618316 RepID=UPI003983CD40